MPISTLMQRSRETRLSRRELAAVFLAGAMVGKAESPDPQRIELKASDGVDVYAWHYAAKDKALPAILLFHQAGSNHAEYSTIAPRLAAAARARISRQARGRHHGITSRASTWR